VELPETGSRFIEALSGRGFVVLADVAQGLLQRFHAPLTVAEEGDSRGLERVGVGGRLDRGDALTLDHVSFVQVFVQIHGSLVEARWAA
jgi:hypothetical protein